MKQVVIDAIKVILMLAVGAIFVAFMYIRESNSYISKRDSETQDTIVITPRFYMQTAEEGLSSALLYYDLQYPEIVYAQAQVETGYFKSDACTKYNNLFGLYDSKNKRYCRFNHWAESVIAYKKWVQSKYTPCEDYYKFLNRINYAEDLMYISKLKQVIKRENDKRRYDEGNPVSQRL